MSNSLAVLRAGLRNTLLDVAPPYVWPDALLNEALLEAIAEHAYLFPQQVRLTYTTTAGQTSQIVFATDGVPPMSSNPLPGPGAVPNYVDLIGVQGVELPVGAPLPRDPRPTNVPPYARLAQAWWWYGGTIYFRNALSGPEVGAGLLLVDVLQTYQRPSDDGTVAWNGPTLDLPLLSLLAQRAAYQALAGVQARDQVASGGKWDIPRILVALDGAISRALTVRKSRAVRSRSLDV